MFSLLHCCDREEWAWLQSHVYTTTSGSVQNLLNGEDETLMESTGLLELIRSLRAAITHLLTKLNIPLYRVKNMISNCHIKKILLPKHLCYEMFMKDCCELDWFVSVYTISSFIILLSGITCAGILK